MIKVSTPIEQSPQPFYFDDVVARLSRKGGHSRETTQKIHYFRTRHVENYVAWVDSKFGQKLLCSLACKKNYAASGRFRSAQGWTT